MRKDGVVLICFADADQTALGCFAKSADSISCLVFSFFFLLGRWSCVDKYAFIMNASRFVCQSRLLRLINLKRWSLNDGLDLFCFFSLVP